MNIACWSPVRGDICGYVAGLFAAVLANEFPCRVVALENYLKRRNLGHCLVGARYDVLREDYSQYDANCHRGDTYLDFMNRKTNRAVFRKRCLEVQEGRLFFLPQNQSLPKVFYDYGIREEYEELESFCHLYFDYAVWNVETNNNVATSRIVQDADQIVAVVPFDVEKISDVLEHFQNDMYRVQLVLYGYTNNERELEKGMKKVIHAFKLNKNSVHLLPITDDCMEMFERGKFVDYVLARKETKESGVIDRIRALAFEISKQEYTTTPSDYRELSNYLYRRNHESYEGEYLPELKGRYPVNYAR